MTPTDTRILEAAASALRQCPETMRVGHLGAGAGADGERGETRPLRKHATRRIFRVVGRCSHPEPEQNTMARILGINDEVTACDCCGRMGLKKTVAIEFADGSDGRFGVVCAAAMLEQDAAAIRKEAARAEKDRQRAVWVAAAKAREVEQKAWEAFCAPYGGIIEAIDHFGGYTLAKAAHAAA